MRKRTQQHPPQQKSQQGGQPIARPTGLQQPTPLQGLLGNQAIGRMVDGGHAIARVKPGVRQRPTLHRLVTKEEFRKQTNAGFLAMRGKTLKQIESLLDEYHGFREKGLHLKPGATQDRALNILYEIRENVNLWMDTHEGDTSRSKNRVPGMSKLFIDAGKELAELTKIRDAAREYMGQDQSTVDRTENQFKTKMEGPVSSILTKIGPLIGAATPASGDTAEFEIEVKCPVEPSGVAYVGFRFAASVERLKGKALKVGFEVAVTGGAQVPEVFEAGGELGMYIEAQGESPEKAMELVSYGMYRRLRESKVIPNEVANFIWGGSATAVGWKRAEKWAAKVEKENFKDSTVNVGGTGDSDEQGSYVETGGLVGGHGKGGVGGVVDLEGSLGFKTGTKYDYESVKNLKSAGLGNQSKLPTRRGQTEVIGESVHHLELALSATGGPFSGGLTVGFDWATQKRQGRAKLQSLTVALAAGASIPMNELVAKGIGGYIPPLVSNLVVAIRKAAAQAAGEKSTASQDAGTMISAAENGATSIVQIAQVPQTVWTPKFEAMGEPDTFSAPAEVKLTLTGGYDFTTGEFKFEAKLEYIKGIEVNAGVFAMKIKKGQKLVRVFYEGGKWDWD